MGSSEPAEMRTDTMGDARLIQLFELLEIEGFRSWLSRVKDDYKNLKVTNALKEKLKDKSFMRMLSPAEKKTFRSITNANWLTAEEQPYEEMVQQRAEQRLEQLTTCLIPILEAHPRQGRENDGHPRLQSASSSTVGVWALTGGRVVQSRVLIHGYGKQDHHHHHLQAWRAPASWLSGIRSN